MREVAVSDQAKEVVVFDEAEEAAVFGGRDGSSNGGRQQATTRGDADEGLAVRGHEQGPGRPRDVGERLAQRCVKGRRGGAVGKWPSAKAIGERGCF